MKAPKTQNQVNCMWLILWNYIITLLIMKDLRHATLAKCVSPEINHMTFYTFFFISELRYINFNENKLKNTVFQLSKCCVPTPFDCYRYHHHHYYCLQELTMVPLCLWFFHHIILVFLWKQMPPGPLTGFLFHLEVHQLSVSVETEPKNGK